MFIVFVALKLSGHKSVIHKRQGILKSHLRKIAGIAIKIGDVWQTRILSNFSFLSKMNAVIIAKNWGISELVIGVTVIALGTSLPELVTSCLAAIKGHNNISIGNLIGSNIFNVFAVIGITASVKPINVDESVLYFDFPVMLGITLFLGCILLGSKINRAIGYALLVAYFTYILFSIL